jgi:predicted transcriptional regulator
MHVVGLLHDREPSSVQDIQAALARAGHDLAYTTVMTVLTRLHEKGVLVRTKDGRRYLYAMGKRGPAVTQGIVARIQKALFPTDRARPILALLDDDALSDEELRLVRRRIDERLRRKS